VLTLSKFSPFASGGNRDCYVHPLNPERCLKVIKKIRSPELRRAEKSFPANLRSLDSFNENLVEMQQLEFIRKCFPTSVSAHLPKAYGIVETDIGNAFETDLIRDEDGLISRTVEQYIWQVGYDADLTQALEQFYLDWSFRCPLTRDLIPHNLVIRFTGKTNIFIIDGLGRMTHSGKLISTIASKYIFNKRKRSLETRIATIRERIASNCEPDYRIHGINRRA
jgi:hypothetical protein